jgi:hypothetical protein
MALFRYARYMLIESIGGPGLTAINASRDEISLNPEGTLPRCILYTTTVFQVRLEVSKRSVRIQAR